LRDEARAANLPPARRRAAHEISIAGVITGLKVAKSKRSGELYAQATLEDTVGNIELIAFSANYEKLKDKLKIEVPVVVRRRPPLHRQHRRARRPRRSSRAGIRRPQEYPVRGVERILYKGHNDSRGSLPMDQALVDVFEQARKVVADADRKIAEEEERRSESEREQLLQQLGARFEDSFDFTSKEK